MELWDLYDENRVPLGRTHPRGEPVPEGTYHLAVIVVILNPKGEVLLTRRAKEKAVCPGWWENTGGAALAGETSLQAILRELREETGLAPDPQELTLLLREDRRTDAHRGDSDGCRRADAGTRRRTGPRDHERGDRRCQPRRRR